MKVNFGLEKICSLGDSVMRGIVVKDKTVAPVKYNYMISDYGFVNICQHDLGVAIQNYACFGSTVAHGMKSIMKHEEEIRQSNYVVFEYGGNDCDFDWKAVSENPDIHHLCKTPIDVFHDKYVELLKKVKELGAKPVVLSLPVIDSDRFFDTVSQGLNRDNILRFLGGKTVYIEHWHEIYNLEVFKLAKSLDVPMIDITTPFLERPDYLNYLCDDGMHPNQHGHKLIADTIYSYCNN